MKEGLDHGRKDWIMEGRTGRKDWIMEGRTGRKDWIMEEEGLGGRTDWKQHAT